ncbi:ATPase [Cohnella lubricantis]|uniref:ATPase n=2 Tax=Cohnella lubricantis TaxID=2163172 RepID=A0A841TF34_9BACL|nr:BadF/BadG/BcrA/BcrD ATPase family protein [Cohnella lubricantis]MBB6678695.1 ATPase [Cohnella lubricantis]
MRYAAGLDGGGTKTAVTVVNEAGEVVRAFASGPINYNGQDEASIRASFREMMALIAEACGGLDRCGHICIGAAGVSNPAVSSLLEGNVRDSGFTGGLTIVGDHETALYAALDSPNGAILIAGTGSICFGRSEDGATHRTGGGGHLVDDEGSGYSIGRDLIAAVLRASDGRSPETVITRLVLDRLGVESVQALIGFVYSPGTNKKDIAGLAPLLSEANALGDPEAQAIVRKCADSLFELAVPVIERLQLQEKRLAMAGSVLQKNGAIRELLLDRLTAAYPRLDCVMSPQDASLGAARMALAQTIGDS